MAKKPRTTEQWLIPQLRNIARRWPEKTKARAKASRRVQIGFFKNGKPQYKTMFECAACTDLFEKEETQMDHRDPVVEVTGFVDWNTYISRLLCPANGFDCLCKPCHLLKSLDENDQRRENKKVSK